MGVLAREHRDNHKKHLLASFFYSQEDGQSFYCQTLLMSIIMITVPKNMFIKSGAASLKKIDHLKRTFLTLAPHDDACVWSSLSKDCYLKRSDFLGKNEVLKSSLSFQFR